MGGRFVNVDRDTPYLLPPSVQEWLPEGHLARFVVEVVEQLDLGKFTRAYAGRGSDALPPSMMVALLFYGYATGVYSSRRLERETYDSVAMRFVAGNQHPDHDTIANFRKRFLKELGELFAEILKFARAAGLLAVGKVSLDGTKIQANASKHSAMSWEHTNKIEAQLRGEVERLLELAEQADAADLPDDLMVPDELKRREDRLAVIRRVKEEIEARAAERYARERAEYEEKMARREAKERSTGRKAGGSPPKAPEPGPQAKDQVNLTDAESRIMPSHGGFEQAYNAQAAVDVETMLIVEQHVSQNTNDKQEVEKALENLEALESTIGKPDALIADAGYYSAENVERCAAHGIEPYIASGRESHYPPLAERLRPVEPVAEAASDVERMKQRLRTIEGREIYAKRKCTIEPVFGIMKAVLGFRQFLLRGARAVGHEWTLMCMGWNLKRLHRLRMLA